MEIVFALISIVVTAAFILLMGRTVLGSWRKAKRFFSDSVISFYYIALGLFCAMIIFAFLCALNNTYWHLDYLTTEGLWQR